MIDWIRRTNDPEAPWESMNFTRVDATGIETSLSLDLQEIIPSQHGLKKLNVAYCYINQNKEESDDIQSQYALEYLRHKLVGNLQMSLWRQLERW